MRFIAYLFLSTVFFACSAMTCDYEDTPESCRLVDIELSPLDNSGQKPLVSDNPINRNAFVIGVDYIVTYPYSKDPEYYREYIRNTQYIINNIADGPRIYTVSGFGKGYPAGSDITGLFSLPSKDVYGMYNQIMILREAPPTGEYTFMVRIKCTDKVIEKEIGPINLF